MKGIYKKLLLIFLPLIVIGVVVLSVRVFWGEEEGLPACEYGRDFIALFKNIEAGDFVFIRVEQDGSAQFVNNIRYRSSINKLSEGQISIAVVKSIFEKANGMRFFELKDFYEPVDSDIVYEFMENNRLIISSNNKCRRVIFHGSRDEFTSLSDLIFQSVSSLPESNTYGIFINASDIFETKREYRSTYKFDLDQLKQYPELLEAILKPEAFIHIISDREHIIRDLGKGKREFYVNFKNKEFIVRLFDRTKSK